VANLRARADAGVEWLFKLKALYANCGVQLDTVAKVRLTTGAHRTYEGATPTQLAARVRGATRC
jgi:hypothetical protein